MKILNITLLFFIFSIIAKPQTNLKTEENPALNYQKFQKFSENDFNSDSAVHYLKKASLSKIFRPFLKDNLHNHFPQALIKSKRSDSLARTNQTHYEEILNKIEKDTSVWLKTIMKPVVLWSKIQDNEGNEKVLQNLGNDFLQLLIKQNIYENKSGRFGLLVFEILNKDHKMRPLAQNIYNCIKVTTKNNLINYSLELTREELEKRAWYRYIFAYINNYEANKTSNNNQKGLLLKTAFDYSPDLVDQNHKSYFYDIFFLSSNDSFEENYITFLENNGSNKQEVLQSILKIALANPNYKEKLEEYFGKNNDTNQKFNEFWTEAIEASAIKAPEINGSLISLENFSIKGLLGKWILLDFWGTWCIPCRIEHPELQEFYTNVVLKNTDKIALLTLACRDSDERVTNYMKDESYNFPVTISNGNYEKLYHVTGYPTKNLITPKGKYVTIPFNIDWVTFIKKYTGI